MQAVSLILDALPRVYRDGSDLEARTAMANAATIAGLAFSNAFVGLNHALAHAVGARFGIAHGRANAIFLPHVLRYNASLPSKFMPAPGYSAYVAPEKYAQIAWILGLGGETEEARRERLFARVDELLAEVGEPRSLSEAGVGADELRGLAARPREGRVQRSQHPDEPAHPAAARDRRAARGGVLMRTPRQRPSADNHTPRAEFHGPSAAVHGWRAAHASLGSAVTDRDGRANAHST